MRKPKPRLGRIKTTPEGSREAVCNCGVIFLAASEDLIRSTWNDHAREDTHRHRPSRYQQLAAPCTHWRAAEVREYATGDIVAWFCPDCDRQLAEKPPLARPPLPPFTPDPRLTIRTWR